jgi:hypothetical protein
LSIRVTAVDRQWIRLAKKADSPKPSRLLGRVSRTPTFQLTGCRTRIAIAIIRPDVR